MRRRTAIAAAAAALGSILLATSGHAAAKPQIVDPKGDAVGSVAGTDIQSVLFELLRKGKKARLRITLTLDAPANRTPGVLYRVYGDQSACGSFQLSSAATLAVIEQNQVYMTCGDDVSTAGDGTYTIINVTPESIGNKLVWEISLRELPKEMQAGTMSNLEAFVTPAEPVMGIVNPADYVAAASFDSATGTSSFRY